MKVKFLPKKSIDVQICDIYEDRDAVICQHSDTLRDDTTYNVEALGFKFGLRPLAYIWSYTGLASDLKDLYDMGVMRFGQYNPSDRYRDDNGSAGYLPDYSATTLSQTGATFYGRNVGESKPQSYPNQGQELFDYTNGKRGYDVTNSKAGLDGNRGWLNEVEYQAEWFKSVFGRFSSVASDRQGQIGSPEIYMPYYLYIRDTEPKNKTSYGKTNDGRFLGLPQEEENRTLIMQRFLTTRWELGMRGIIPIETANQNVVNGVNNAFLNKGMYTDFLHWYWAISQGGDVFWLHHLYELIYNSVNGRNAWYCGEDQAIEYMWFRRMTKRVRGSFINDKLYLIADFDDEFINKKLAGIDKKLVYNRIKQPLSVKIDLSGTQFEDKEITSNVGKIISKGENQYIIDIPFIVAQNGFKEVIISVTSMPNYKNLNKPQVLSFSNGVVTTDLPCRAILYNGDFHESMTRSQRQLELKTSHAFTLASNSKYIGLITEDGQSILYTI